MKLQYILLSAAAALMSLNGCGNKEPNELAHHHHHGHEGHDHGHEDGDHHEHEHEHEHEHGHEHGHEHEGHVEEAHNHESSADIITLEPDIAKRFGVEVSKVTLRRLGDVIKVSGVIEPSAEGTASVSAHTSGILTLSRNIAAGAEVKAGSTIGSINSSSVTGGDANRVAKAELDAAKAEFDRIAPLYAERLVTASQYNAAKAAYERAKAAYSAPAAGGRATAPISGTIISLDATTGQYVEVGTTIATIATSGRLTLRADVPSRYAGAVRSVTGGRMTVPYSDNTIELSQLDAKRLSISDAAGRGGYIPVVFSLRNDGSVVPGTAVEVYLTTEGSRETLTVPKSALAEQQGDYFVYVRLDEDCYRKVPVKTGISDGRDIEILSGLKPGQDVVSQGVTTVRLAAASGAIPEGHSHSH